MCSAHVLWGTQMVLIQKCFSDWLFQTPSRPHACNLQCSITMQTYRCRQVGQSIPLLCWNPQREHKTVGKVLQVHSQKCMQLCRWYRIPDNREVIELHWWVHLAFHTGKDCMLPLIQSSHLLCMFESVIRYY